MQRRLFVCGLLGISMLNACAARQSGQATAADDRSLYEGVRLFDLAIDKSSRSLDGAISLSRQAEAAIANVRGDGAIPATTGELAARIANAVYVFTERHRFLTRLLGDADTLLREHRPGAALATIERMPVCDAATVDTGTAPLGADLSEPCWPTADRHFEEIHDLRRAARDAVLAVERLIDRADAAAWRCHNAGRALDDYVWALTIDADAVPLIDPRIARALACGSRSPAGRSLYSPRPRGGHVVLHHFNDR